MSEKNKQSVTDISNELPEGFDPIEAPAEHIETAAQENAVKKNVPKKRASKKAKDPNSDTSKESLLPAWDTPNTEGSETNQKEDDFFDLLSFSRKNNQEAPKKSPEFEATKFSVTDSAELKIPQKEAEAKKESEKAADQKASATEPKKKKKSFNIVEAGLKITKHSDHAKLIFVLCMVLLSPLALLVTLAVLLLFLLASTVTVLAAGVMALTVLAVVVAGVIAAMIGIAYGAINLMTAEGFALIVGRYELGLGIAIAGITVVISALLYSGITDLVPYLFKKMGKLFKFLVKKTKELIVRLYKYSTQL